MVLGVVTSCIAVILLYLVNGRDAQPQKTGRLFLICLSFCGLYNEDPFLTCRAKNTDACLVIAILYQCSLAREKQVDGKTKCLDFCFKTPKYKPGFLFPQSF